MLVAATQFVVIDVAVFLTCEICEMCCDSWTSTSVYRRHSSLPTAASMTSTLHGSWSPTAEQWPSVPCPADWSTAVLNCVSSLSPHSDLSFSRTVNSFSESVAFLYWHSCRLHCCSREDIVLLLWRWRILIHVTFSVHVFKESDSWSLAGSRLLLYRILVTARTDIETNAVRVDVMSAVYYIYKYWQMKNSNVDRLITVIKHTY